MHNEHYSLEAEVEFLGMLIQDNSRLENVDYILPEYFYLTVHGEIFAIIKNLIAKTHPADILNIAEELVVNEDFKNVGGKNYLTKIQQTLSYSTIRGRAELIYSLWLKRKLVSTGQELVKEAHNTNITSIQDTVDNFISKVSVLSNIRQNDSYTHSMGDIIAKNNETALKNRNRNGIIGLACGLHDLDNILTGFTNGTLNILAARPSMGKTTLADRMIYNMAKSGIRVGFFSLEMDSYSITNTLTAIHLNTELSKVIHSCDQRGNPISDAEFNKIREGAMELVDYPIFQNDKSGQNITNLCRQAKKMKKDKKIDILFIDHLSIIHGTQYKNNNKVLEIGEITSSLKALARDLNIPIVLLSQLSRAVETRDNKQPTLSDLRDSGSIEQDADVVMFLYREAYYLERLLTEKPVEPTRTRDDTPEIYKTKMDTYKKEQAKYVENKEKFDKIKNRANVFVAKNRMGRIGSVELFYEGEKGRFSNKYENSVTNNKAVEKTDVKQVGRSDWDKLEEVDF